MASKNSSDGSGCAWFIGAALIGIGIWINYGFGYGLIYVGAALMAAVVINMVES